MLRRGPSSKLRQRPRYLEPLVPVVFPEEAQVPEGQVHFELRTILYQLLSDHLGPDFTVCSDQFMYFDAADPRRCLAPDVYVRLAPRGAPIVTWKTWERGAPEIAIEIVSPSDRVGEPWAAKLQRYRHAGVAELVRFDHQAAREAERLRIWDRVDDALVERAVEGTRAPSLILDLHWVLAPADGYALALRIGVGEEGDQLLLTRAEARKAEAEARKAEAEARKTEVEAREARIRELEAELARVRESAK
ncbi:MAG: Uma2 family endonuclease [Myxococcota bacterium]